MPQKRRNRRRNKQSKQNQQLTANKQSNNSGPTKQIEASVGRKILRALGGVSGGALGLLSTGSLAGAAQGARYGYGAGNQAATIMGMGAYSVKKNSLKNTSLMDSVPYMHSSDQSVVIRHQEFLGNVISSSSANNFNVSAAYSLNPGQAETFPWLSSIAQNFQEYTFRGLAFYFRSTSADAIASSTNTALGTVMMGTIYNPILPAFTGKVQMLNEYYSNDCKPSENMIHLVECDPAENPFRVQYVRPGTVPLGASVQNYDLGNFYIATAGFQGTSVVCGELFVTYEVELKKPVPAGLAGVYNGAHITATAGISTSAYFGSNTIYRYNNWYGGSVTNNNNTVTIPPGFGGNLMVIYSVIGTSGALTNVNLAVANLIPYNNFGANGSTAFLAPGSVTSSLNVIVETYSVSQSDLASTITISGGTLPGSPTSMDCIIIPLPGSNTALSF